MLSHSITCRGLPSQPLQQFLNLTFNREQISPPICIFRFSIIKMWEDGSHHLKPSLWGGGGTRIHSYVSASQIHSCAIAVVAVCRGIPSVASPVRRGKVKEPSRFLLFLPDFSSFSWFFFTNFPLFSRFHPSFCWFSANFWLSRGTLPPLPPYWLRHWVFPCLISCLLPVMFLSSPRCLLIEKIMYFLNFLP